MARGTNSRPRTRAELEAALCEQVSVLNACSRTFDGGQYAQALPIATALRTVFHTPREGVALFAQLGMLEGPWSDYSFPILATEAGVDCCHLAEMLFEHSNDGVKAQVLPILDHGSGPVRELMFEKWWTMPIGHSAKFGSLSRRDVVLGLANTEAAHVSEEVTDKAIALREGTYLTVEWFDGDVTGHFPFVAHAAARTIAHEVLVTIAHRHRRFLRETYMWNPDRYEPEKFAGFSAHGQPRLPPGAVPTSSVGEIPRSTIPRSQVGSPGHDEWLLDEALLETFPASDPISPSWPPPVR
jgi:hypothetical protein